jgi:hypothetical protein
VFASCSGAVIDNFYPNKGQYNEQQGQLQSLDVRDKIVALTVGGNDVHFADVMLACISPENCAGLDSLVSLRISVVRSRLGELYSNMLAAAPRAQIYVVGYPHLFARRITLSCRAQGLLNSEVRWLNGKVDDLNAASKFAISGIDNARLHFVDTTTAFQGGEACSDSHLFMNEAVLSPDIRYSFHPTAAGQLMLAGRLARAVRG